MSLAAAEREVAKEQIRDVLRDVARRRELITYVDLVARLDGVRLHQRSPDLHQILGELSEEEARADAGMLSAVAVAKDTGRPGRGFFDLAAKLGRDVERETAFWRDELERVYETNARAVRPPVSERAISVRLDEEAEAALSFLVRRGTSRSDAIREALVEAAARARRDELSEEARRLADDASDRDAIAEVATFMDALSAER